MRSIGTQLAFRMRQSTSLFFDEYVGKVARVRARHGTNAEIERALAAKLGDAAFWELHDRTIAAARRWESPHASVTVSEMAAMTSWVGPKNEPRGETAMTVGAILLGIGVVVGVAGAIALSQPHVGVGGAVPVTIGAAVGFAGLIALLVGATLRATLD